MTAIKIAAILAFAILLLAARESRASDPWDTTDKVLFGAVATSYAVDCLQTLDIKRKPDIYETNAILGDRPSDDRIIAYFIGAGVATYLVADWLPSEWRKKVLGGTLLFQIGVTRQNYSLGLEIKL